MRVGVLWSAAVLALLAVSGALRTFQAEGVTRTSRRLEAPSDPEISSSTSESPESVPNHRSRYSRRQESTRDVNRTRARSRPETTERAQPERVSGNGNERFDSRRTRTRTRPETQPAEPKETTRETFKNTAIRSRSRARRPTSQSPDVSSPIDAKFDTNTNTDGVTVATKINNRGTSQFRRRSSTVPTETVTIKRDRGTGRINTRPKIIDHDLDSSGSTNTILVTDKEPTTARTSADLRDARKLRYKTRPVETDSNLTGGEISAVNEIKSSQTENATSQTVAPIFVERIVQQSTETNKPSTTLKVTRVVRRPIARGKATHTPSVAPSKKSIDDIDEDDNYPESFKALIQAKNATQVNSPAKESLSVTASQKVVSTYSTSSSSSHSTQTDTAENNQLRFRNKQVADASNKSSNYEEVATGSSEVSKSDRYKPRGKYSIKNKKTTTFRPDTTIASSTEKNIEKPVNKYHRKFKVSSPNPVSRIENNSSKLSETSAIKKSAIRPSFQTRKFGKHFATSTEVSVTVSEKKEENIIRKKLSLPRTTYYSRLRNKTETSTSTEIPTEPLQNKTEDLNDMPLIFTLFNHSENTELASDSLKKEENEIKEPFIISISSTESQENILSNEVKSTVVKENENSTPSLAIKQEIDRQKFHANYKKPNRIMVEENTQVSSSTAFPVRNLQRKRQRTRQKAKIEDSPETSTARSRDRNVRKFSEAFSKTTEASNNGIIPGTDKAKNKFSSKYRASYLDKPFYKPTVPSITSSTAWLKFFVTDHLLPKSVEEPNWFRDHVDETTESATNVTAPYIHPSHTSSFELVEGEEMQLGPDNAISITQTRRTLSSADLRLSESLLKSSQVMNVEASHHSPSVTVSIFDALAEILTSTPKTRLSSTTEVTTKPNLNTDVTQILNGVSNIVNVNSPGSIISPDTFVPANASTTTQSVQNTNHTTPIVINNNMLAGEIVTQSVTTEGDSPLSTPQTPIPTPTTPLSARRPFAIKLLYSDTDSPIDKTATDHMLNQPTTDNPKMVYNTVSDLLLSNNNLVSEELTSMLSNNIKSIIQTMDEDSRSRISVDMAKLLQSLIPRAIDGLATRLDNRDSIPLTTPYSLEDIKDTENIRIDTNLSSFDILQSVTTDNSVNNVEGDRNMVTSSVIFSDNPTQSVNNLDTTQGVTQGPFIGSDSQTTSKDFLNTVQTDLRSDFETITSTSTSTPSLLTTTERVTSSVLNDSNVDNVNSVISSGIVTNNSVPLPFLTNFQVRDFTTSDTEVINMTNSLALKQEFVETTPSNFDPSNISPLQLWVLSKKANVLKMIEDIIRQHNTELATAPTFVEMISPSKNNINLSERLTKIMNTMTFTTDSSTLTTNSDTTFSTITSSPNPTSPTTESSAVEKLVDVSSTPNTLSFDGFQASQDDLQTTTEVFTNLSFRFGAEKENGNNNTSTTTESSTRNTLIKTTEGMTDQDTNLGTSTAAESIQTTTLQDNTETTTASANTETTTQLDIETTTQIIDDSSTTVSETTVGTNETPNITPEMAFSAATPTIPKKDYVIFGILPNNTVVRKDPNDDALESLTEASPYIVYGLLPNNTVIRKFPNGTRVPRIMQKIDILPISPWSLRNPYSPIHNIPAIVRPQSNPIRVSTNTVTSTDITNNGTDTVNNQETMISSSALNIKSSSLGITTVTNKPPAEISTASHVLSLRTTTMLPSIDEILLNSISSAAKQEMVISSMTSSTREPTILTLDIDPETKQIRTERPSDGNGNSVFKFIPIDEVMIKQQNSNVLKLATKAPMFTNTENSEVQIETVTKMTEVNTQSTQKQGNSESTSTTTQETTIVTNTPLADSDSTTVSQTTEATTITLTTTQAPTTTQVPTTTLATTTQTQTTTAQVPTTTTTVPPTTTIRASTTTEATTTQLLTTTTESTTKQTTNYDGLAANNQVTQNLLNSRDPKYLSVQSFNNLLTGSESSTTTKIVPTIKQNDPTALLQALLSATGNNNGGLSLLNTNGNTRNSNKEQSTTSRSLEEDIRQFEEDTKLLKALLAATGQNPASLNIPSLDTVFSTTRLPTTQAQTTTTRPTTTTTRPTTTTTRTTTTKPTTASTRPTTTTSTPTATPSLQDDLKQFQEDAKLLQALLQATGQNTGNINLPDISKVTSNVRVASNPLTTQIGSNPTTALNSQAVFTTTNGPVFRAFDSRTPAVVSTTEDVKISTTFTPFIQRSTTRDLETGTISGRQAPPKFTVTTEVPSSSTFSVEEDLQFLKNLKQVLNTNGDEDPEAALANRIISLAVDRSLTEIQTSNAISPVRTGKTIANGANNLEPSTSTTSTTTTTTAKTTPRMTTTQATTTQRATSTTGGLSIDDDIKQFQEDTKLLQALLKATGQDPSKFNIPTLPNITPTVSSHKSEDFKVSTIASPSRQNDATPKPSMRSTMMTDKPLPFGAKIAVMDSLRTVQDDRKLLKTLIKLQDAQETTTFRSKLVGTGQTSDEALKKLIQQQKATGMVSEATKSPISLSTEYGKSNDALLAALLKEQGFGPTTASSIDEQVRLAALLNQVVVTPKARRPTTPPPPPPPPRRPVLDGLAWLWQQWRETGPGPAPTRASQRPGPAPAVRPSEATSNRVNWFGSGPFTGNADDRPASSNRVPLEPPRAVTSVQTPGRGQIVSAAINMTRAFSQFLGAAFQGAAQTVQSVIRAGQRAASDVYTNGSGGSG